MGAHPCQAHRTHGRYAQPLCWTQLWNYVWWDGQLSGFGHVRYSGRHAFDYFVWWSYQPYSCECRFLFVCLWVLWIISQYNDKLFTSNRNLFNSLYILQIFAQYGFLPSDCTTLFCKAMHLEPYIKELGIDFKDLLIQVETGEIAPKVRRSTVLLSLLKKC